MPNHIAGPAAPTAEEAYADAPDDEVEMLALMNLVRAEDRTPQERGREWMLRYAAQQDRAALRRPAPPAGSVPIRPGGRPPRDPADFANQLRELDRRDGSGRGLLGPDAPEWDGGDNPLGYVRQEYLAWRSGQLSDLAAVGAAMRAMAEVTDDNGRSGQAAGRGEPWPREQLLDLARRRVAAYMRAVDFGIDAVADQRRAEAELRELEVAGGSARR
ncbi:hypothetical protein [Streptomyces sp. NRRL B-24484]|uniref:hypothetical protein n=1 Tax=Streptomyces sp. NRRL B-24484 TaxID=1463833 RepID=UPI0004C02D12|nr:hypothetical protein [Streptomyces sp. NRRL B-24484]